MDAVIAIDVGGTKIAGAVVCYGPDDQEIPTITYHHTIPTNASQGGDAVAASIVGLVGELLEKARAEGDTVLGIGVAAAGSIDEAEGVIEYANDLIPGWMGQPLGAKLREAYGLPVSIINDVRAYALGEHRYGAARGANSCIMAATGTGLGGAIILDGQLLDGAHHFAGMLGHTQHPAAMEVTSAWETKGNLEAVASGSGIETCYRMAGGEPVSGAEISDRAKAGEPLAQQVIEQAGRSLGEAIASWADVIDPDVVVVSGSVSNAGPRWRDALTAGFTERLAPELEGLQVVDATLGGDAPLIGAAERVRDRCGKDAAHE